MSETTLTPAAPETAAADDARDNAEFGAGFDDGKTKPGAAETAAPPRTAEPEFVKITAAEWADVRAAAAKTASYDQQLSKAFGTIGNLQKLVSGFQAQTPSGRRVEIPKDAFAAMERDFPELAQQTRSALEAALSGLSGTGAADADPGKLESMLSSYTAKREIEALEDAWPEWRTIVGAVDVAHEQPDANNAFRKWLAGKEVAYQNRINRSESAAVISRAIRLFHTETKGRAAATAAPPRGDARAERIRGAVQPRGDNAGAPAGKSDDEEFEAGFNSR